MIKVKHVHSDYRWATPKDGSKSWIDYWCKYSGFDLHNFCRDCGCHPSGDNIFVGAHVIKVNSTDQTIYIVPVCKACNTRGASDCHEFECDERILVPANKNNL